MPSQFVSAKYALGFCDRCGFRFRLRELRTLTIKTKRVSIKVCSECWEPDHPQLQLGMYPVNDPQALRDPRPDTNLAESRALLIQLNVGAGVGVSCGPTSVMLVAPYSILTEDRVRILTEDDVMIFSEF